MAFRKSRKLTRGLAPIFFIGILFFLYLYAVDDKKRLDSCNPNEWKYYSEFHKEEWSREEYRWRNYIFLKNNSQGMTRVALFNLLGQPNSPSDAKMVSYFLGHSKRIFGCNLRPGAAMKVSFSSGNDTVESIDIYWY